MTHPQAVLALAATLAIGLGVGGPGCAAPARTRRLSPSAFQAARLTERPASSRRRAEDESAALVAHRLHAAGLRFGTDGSARALWGYLRTSHQVQVVDPAEARAGDILFFDTRSRADEASDCGDHAGIVETTDSDGRITFIEARGGQTRQSYLQPALPLVRRGSGGQILNTFLRPKRISDPPGTRYFAGQMLCGVARVRSP
jgi:hypothetical protein